MATSDAPRKISDRSIEQFAGPDLVREGTRGRGPIGMNATVHALGPVLLVSAFGEAQEIERRPLAPGMPTLDFIFVETGTFRYLAGSAWEECSGPLMIAPSGLPQRVRFITPWRFLVARIATEALRPFLPALPERAQAINTLRLPERAMAGYLASVGNDSSAAPGESLTASRLIVEMAGAVLRDRFGDGSPQGHPGVEIWGHAQAVIAEECANPDFDPRALAQRVGCSLRRLQAEFTDRGTTVAAEIRRERARIAYALLRDPAQAGARMALIAERSGFGATSTMHRVIAECYGVTPTQLRGIAERSADPSVVE
ncbi:helix-turn-helix domain-containing protein [Leucobacter celer]|uniref:helix-turn-helix domain-containing protein n=1 Tax=Leucobacter celer TaxID=668625 RepID=UPI0006A7E60C|nr:helix-turn-helix domain-containing protein [Leucobacter celer]